MKNSHYAVFYKQLFLLVLFLLPGLSHSQNIVLNVTPDNVNELFSQYITPYCVLEF